MSDYHNKSDIVTLTIDELDDAGNGIGTWEGKKVVVPYSLPQECVDVDVVKQNKHQIWGGLHELKVSSPHRVEPQCRHFTDCGGCKLQHLEDKFYQQYRQSILSRALHKGGYEDAAVDGVLEVGEHSRRKVQLKVKAGRKQVKLGFYAEAEHKIVDVTECFVASEEIVALLPALREFILTLTRAQRLQNVDIFQAENGLMVKFISEASVDAQEIKAIEVLCQAEGIIFFAWDNGDDVREVFVAQEPYILIDKWKLPVTMEAFSQATIKGQKAINELIEKYVEGDKYILDLYAGYGTYTLPMVARQQQVVAYEGAWHMVEMLQNVIDSHYLSDFLQVKCRDLLKFPLKEDEIGLFDAVVINPPRNGAGPQMKKIAESDVPKVVMVSCSALSLAKDIRFMAEAGYEIEAAYVIDQFIWSGHIESVVIFKK